VGQPHHVPTISEPQHPARTSLQTRLPGEACPRICDGSAQVAGNSRSMAFSIDPSQYWDGNDGSWSTFNVNIGTQPQQMRVLPATSQSSTFVVLQQGCPTSSAPANCPSLRGNIFNPAQSKDISWEQQQAPGGDLYFYLPFDSENTLPNFTDSTIAGEVGFDVLNLDWSGNHSPKSSDTIKNQTIAAYASSIPWLGLLGISGRPSHIFNQSSSESSPLQALQNNGDVPSLHWGYTAGKSYAGTSTYGSLTFGGYDSARVDMSSSLSVPFNTDSTRDLQVAIKTITISGISISSTPVSGMPVYALIDSVVPEIWLPVEACSTFESALGLVWNDTYSMYLINDTQHNTLVADDPQITFALASTTENSQGTEITLPYSAFDLTAKYPLAGITDNTTTQRYFPLKRAGNSTQMYLGRTFLQEAYVQSRDF
jgi:hypothetical protein